MAPLRAATTTTRCLQRPWRGRKQRGGRWSLEGAVVLVPGCATLRPQGREVAEPTGIDGTRLDGDVGARGVPDEMQEDDGMGEPVLDCEKGDETEKVEGALDGDGGDVGKQEGDEMHVAEAAGKLGTGGKRRRRPRRNALAEQVGADLDLLDQERARVRNERRELRRGSGGVEALRQSMAAVARDMEEHGDADVLLLVLLERFAAETVWLQGGSIPEHLLHDPWLCGAGDIFSWVGCESHVSSSLLSVGLCKD
ncbi:unnamed protein product [Prorocentrum cordatum]|uniref:Uncharacterized protein n=1 Tax=Prorocentrum cordatum TaxID=2364126 RepID=A0ABN9PQC4_9DINO|nr:unnamed protein product [Polarella glacialis]